MRFKNIEIGDLIVGINPKNDSYIITGFEQHGPYWRVVAMNLKTLKRDAWSHQVVKNNEIGFGNFSPFPGQGYTVIKGSED